MKYDKYRIIGLNLALIVTCLIIGGGVSVHMGQDANADLATYHIYNAWALLHKRWNTDLFVAGIHGYFNPLIDLPYYFLAFDWLSEYPRILAFLMGIPYGLLVYLTTLVTWVILDEEGVKTIWRCIATVLVVVFSVTGVATISQVGTTFNGVKTAVLILTGVYLLVYGLKKNTNHILDSTSATSGLLFGLAAGLKFTTSIYASSAVLAIFIVSQSWSRKFIRSIIFSLFWLIAFTTIYGWWGWHLYALTGNPMYPMFGYIFHSSFTHPINMFHLYHIFKPHTLTQWLFYPYFWLTAQYSAIGLRFADSRFSFGFSSILALVLLLIMKLLRNRQSADYSSQRIMLSSSALFIVIFVAVSYVEWLVIFSYLRYAVPIEALLGIMVMVVLLQLFKQSHKHIMPIASGCMLVIACIALYTTVYPNFGRVAYGKRVWSMQPVYLPSHSMILMFGGPIGYMAPMLAAQNHKISFIGDPNFGFDNRRYKLGESIYQKVNKYNGYIYVLRRTDMDSYSWRKNREAHMMKILKKLGVSVSGTLCLPFSSNRDSDLEICSARNAKNAKWAPAPRISLQDAQSVQAITQPGQHKLLFAATG